MKPIRPQFCSCVLGTKKSERKKQQGLLKFELVALWDHQLPSACPDKTEEDTGLCNNSMNPTERDHQIYQLALHWAFFYWISMYWKVLHWSAMYWLWTDVLICNTFTLWNWPDNNQLHWQLFSNTLSLTYFDLVSSNVIFKLWYRAAELAVGQFFLSLLASPPTLFINWSKLPRNAPNCFKQVQNSQVLVIKPIHIIYKPTALGFRKFLGLVEIFQYWHIYMMWVPIFNTDSIECGRIDYESN